MPSAILPPSIVLYCIFIGYIVRYNSIHTHIQMLHSFLGVDAWMTSQLNVDLIHKLRRSTMCLSHSFDVLSMDVCTTRHWETSAQLVKELNVRTLASALEGLRQICYSIPFPIFCKIIINS